MVAEGFGGDLVIKPLHGNGGKAVFACRPMAATLALVEVFSQMWRDPYGAALPAGRAKGDKRIVLVDGEVAGAINRRPGEGEFPLNLAVGGSAEATGLTSARRKSAALGPELRKRGLVLWGST
jgi:glutathione synthase